MHGRHVWINTLRMVSAFITMWHFTTNLCLVVHKLWYLYLRLDYIMRHDFGLIFLSDRHHCDRLSTRPWLQQCLRKLTGIYRLNAIYRCVTIAPYHPYVRLLCYDSVVWGRAQNVFGGIFPKQTSRIMVSIFTGSGCIIFNMVESSTYVTEPAWKS